ncbi:MAG: hypothetical protein AABY22_28315, partial [Nanoarchaeota archaeon]
MSNIVVLLGMLDGIGGTLLTMQVSDFIYKQNKYPHILIAARNEVFKPLQYLYEGKHKLEQLSELTDDSLLYNP